VGVRGVSTAEYGVYRYTRSEAVTRMRKVKGVAWVESE
jgi:hypothetical protein